MKSRLFCRLGVAAALFALQGSALAQPAPSYTRALNLIQAAPAGSWVKLNTNRIETVWTPSALRPDDSWTLESVIDAWGGMAWDSLRGKLVFKGGGHANYPGNEVFTWDVTTGEWQRGSLPSRLVDLSFFGVTDPEHSGEKMPIDGGSKAAPNSCHEFSTPAYLPTVDRVVYFCGGGQTNGVTNIFARSNGTIFYPGPFFWDPSKADPLKVGGSQGSHVTRTAQYADPNSIAAGNMWQGRGLWESLTVGQGFAFLSASSAYRKEGAHDVLYVTASNDNGSSAQFLYRYQIDASNNPALDTWTLVGNYLNAYEGNGGAFIHPSFEIFVRPRGTGTNFMFWKIDATSAASPTANGEFLIAPTLASGTTFSNANKSALFWDPLRQHAVVWQGGKNIYTLKAPASLSTNGWLLTSLPVANASIGPPPAGNANPVENRLRYIADLDAYVVVAEGLNGDVWAYKPSNWMNVAPNVPPTVSIASPSPSTVFYPDSTIAISANASDSDGGVARVEFYLDDVLVSQDSSAPYSASFTQVPAGNHVLRVVAFDTAGAQSSVSQTLTVVPRDAIVVKHEQAPLTTTGFMTPRVSCRDQIGQRAAAFSYGGTTDAKFYVFPSIAQDMRCVASIQMSSEPSGLFVFPASATQAARSASPTTVVMRSTVVGSTTYQTGVLSPNGSTVAITCRADGRGQIAWQKVFNATVTNGAVSASPVPENAICTIPPGS
jgi:hypothetical protein